MDNLEQQIEVRLNELSDDELNKLAIHLKSPRAHEGIQAPLGVKISDLQRMNFVKWVKGTGNIQKAGIYLGIIEESALPKVGKELKSDQKLERTKIYRVKGEKLERQDFKKPPELVRKKAWAIIIAIIIILGGIWTVIQICESESFKNLFRDSKGDVYVKKIGSHLYRELSPQIKVELISLLQKLRQQYNHINIKISVTSDKGSRVRHRVAEEIAGILASAGFEAKAVSPLIRFTNDTSDVVIKGNESDIELLTQLSKILRRFIKTNTPFSGMKNENFQRGELQIIIAGDPLFSSDGIVTFQ